MARTRWGVDSAQTVTNQLYNCVTENFGKPDFWGRYVTTVPKAAEGLTSSEISFLHQNGIKILPIYSGFKEALGYRNGQIAARNAIFHAQRLGVPKNVFIFANVENFFPVDEAWIRGWVEVFYPSGYRPGFYHDPVKGGFSSAFCSAAKINNQVEIQSVLWSAEPELKPSKKAEAPAFDPTKPPCSANVWAWQYGRDAEACPIDTNVIDTKLFDNLF